MDLSKKAAPKDRMSPVTGMPASPVSISAGKGYNSVARAFEALVKAGKDAELVIVRDDNIKRLFGEAQETMKQLAQALFDAARDLDIPSKGI